MKSTFSVLFYLRTNRKTKDNKNKVMIRITMSGNIKQFYSKIDIDPQKWSSSLQRMTGNSDDAKQVNKTLDSIKAALIHNYKDLLQTNSIVTVEMIKNMFLGVVEKQKTLFYYYNIILKQKEELRTKEELAESTFRRYHGAKRRIQSFIETNYKGAKDLPINEIDHDFISNYAIHLRSSGCQHNMVQKYLQILKTAINYAYSNREIDHNPFTNFPISFKPCKISYLTHVELNKLLKKDFGLEKLNKTRDFFVFCCFSGLAYVDASSLTQDNIVLLKNTDVNKNQKSSKWIVKNRTDRKSVV